MSRIASLKHTGSGGTVSSRSSRNTIPRTFSGSIRMFHRGRPASGSLTLVIAADRDVIFFQDWGTFSRPQGSLSAFAKATFPKRQKCDIFSSRHSRRNCHLDRLRRTPPRGGLRGSGEIPRILPQPCRYEVFSPLRVVQRQRRGQRLGHGGAAPCGGTVVKG